MIDKMDLWLYSISYQKPGASFTLDEQGTAAIREEVRAVHNSLVVNTDYQQRVIDTQGNVVLSFITRPSPDTVVYNRVWSNKEIGDAFYAENDSTIFNLFRQNGWNVSYTSTVFNPTLIPQDAVLL